jgi:hypothetical protein
VIHGNDTDSRVAGVARLNLFMETGGYRPTNLRTHDSLYGDLTQLGYDVILANMPFGLKGIKHAECCNRVKDLKIRGTSLHVNKMGNVRSDETIHSTSLRCAWESDPSISSSNKQDVFVSPRIRELMLRLLR